MISIIRMKYKHDFENLNLLFCVYYSRSIKNSLARLGVNLWHVRLQIIVCQELGMFDHCEKFDVLKQLISYSHIEIFTLELLKCFWLLEISLQNQQTHLIITAIDEY